MVRNSSRDLVALPAKARERAEYMLSGEKNKSEFVPSGKPIMSHSNVYLLPAVHDKRHERIPQKIFLGSYGIRIDASHTKHGINPDCVGFWSRRWQLPMLSKHAYQ